MKKLLVLMALCVQLFSYDFVLLNNSSVDDEFIIDTIEGQMKNYYFDEKNKIVFSQLSNKDAIINLLKKTEYSDDKQVQEEIIKDNEELEDDLRLLFDTKYFLVVSESIDREGRSELRVELKVDNVSYLDTQFVMPKLEDKELHYVNTIANIVLTYIAYKDSSFVKVQQL